MGPHTVGIYYFRMTADSSKVKSTFAFLNEVFHLAPATIKLDNLIRFHIHVCNNKGVHVCQLAVVLSITSSRLTMASNMNALRIRFTVPMTVCLESLKS